MSVPEDVLPAWARRHTDFPVPRLKIRAPHEPGPPPPPPLPIETRPLDIQYGHSPPPDVAYGHPPPSDIQYGPPPPPDVAYGHPPPDDIHYSPPRPPSAPQGPPLPPGEIGPSGVALGHPPPPRVSHGPPQPPDIQHGYSPSPDVAYGYPPPPDIQHGNPPPPGEIGTPGVAYSHPPPPTERGPPGVAYGHPPSPPEIGPTNGPHLPPSYTPRQGPGAGLRRPPPERMSRPPHHFSPRSQSYSDEGLYPNDGYPDHNSVHSKNSSEASIRPARKYRGHGRRSIDPADLRGLHGRPPGWRGKAHRFTWFECGFCKGTGIEIDKIVRQGATRVCRTCSGVGAHWAPRRWIKRFIEGPPPPKKRYRKTAKVPYWCF